MTDVSWFDSLKGEGFPSAHRIAFNRLEEGRGPKYDHYRKEWLRRPREFDQGNFPINLDVEQDANCNLFCRFCARQNDPRALAKGQMKLKTYEIILKEASKYVDTDWWALKTNFRGESTLLPDLGNRIRMAKEAGCIDVAVNTNGNFATERLPDIMDGLDLIAFSLDAVTPHTYKVNRIGGDYKLAYANVHEAIRLRDEEGYKTKVRVSFVHNTTNDKEVRAFLAYWEDHGADAGTINLAFNPMEKLTNENAKKFLSPYTVEKDPNFVCSQPWIRMAVWAGGEVQPCCGAWIDNYRIGDINEGDKLYDLWHGKRMNNLREMNKKHQYTKMPICASCGVSQNRVVRRKDVV